MYAYICMYSMNTYIHIYIVCPYVYINICICIQTFIHTLAHVFVKTINIHIQIHIMSLGSRVKTPRTRSLCNTAIPRFSDLFFSAYVVCCIVHLHCADM